MSRTLQGRRALLSALACGLLLACGARPEPPTPADLAAKAEAPPPVDRSQLPRPAPAAEWVPPPIETWTLPNGLEVWLVTQRQAPLLALELVLPRGAATDPAGKAGLTDLTVDLLDEGAGDRDALQLAEAFQRLATRYGASTATDGVVFSLDLLADQLEPSLALFADVLLRPRLSVDEFERRKAQRLAQALAAEADPNSARTIAVRRALDGAGYGAWPAGGLRHTLEPIGHADVKAHYAALVKPKGAALIAVGAVDRASLEPLLLRHLGEWSGAPDLPVLPVDPTPPARAVYLVDFPGASQSSIGLARRIPGHDEAGEQLFPATVFNWALGGAFTSRLNLNLREEKGYTYGARASLNRWRSAGMYLLAAAVKGETTLASLQESLKELAGMHGARPLTDEEHAQALGGMLLSFPGRFEQLSSVAGQYASVRLDGRTPEWFRAWPKQIGAVTLEAAREAAVAHTRPEDFLIVVAGDAAKLRPALEGLGLPIVALDPQGRPLAAGAAADAKAKAKAKPKSKPKTKTKTKAKGPGAP